MLRDLVDDLDFNSENFSTYITLSSEIESLEIGRAIKLSKTITLPKKKFYKTPECSVEKINKLFENPLTESFECPHCGETYEPREHFMFTDGEYYLPDRCINCKKLMYINRIIKTFGDWAVTLAGIESTCHYYYIFRTRIYELDWMHHLYQKCWVNIYDFACALEWAKHFFGPLFSNKNNIKSYYTKDEYKEYLSSEHWSTVRERALKFYGSCVLCGAMRHLNVHHRNYNHMWKERISKDIIVLCNDCHKKFHGVNNN